MTALKHLDLWNTYLQIAEQARVNEELEQAKRILLYALNDAEEFGELDSRLTFCVYTVAGIFCTRGSLADARCLYSALLEVREKVLGADDPDLLDCWEKKGLALIEAQRVDMPVQARPGSLAAPVT